MKIYIDFSIYVLAGRAYGNVTGYLELPSYPKLGDGIELLDNELALQLGVPSHIRVQSITPVPGYGTDKSVVGLDDVVVESEDIARNLATNLETRKGLFCVYYE